MFDLKKIKAKIRAIEDEKKKRRCLKFQTEPWMRELNNQERQQVYHMFMKLPEKRSDSPGDDLDDDDEDLEQEQFWIDDERIDLSRHIGNFHTALPAFGYPTMNF